MDFLLHAFLVGCGATALVDLWALLTHAVFGVGLYLAGWSASRMLF